MVGANSELLVICDRPSAAVIGMKSSGDMSVDESASVNIGRLNSGRRSGALKKHTTALRPSMVREVKGAALR